MLCSIGKREEMNKIINIFKLLNVSFTDTFFLSENYRLISLINVDAKIFSKIAN